MWHRIACRQQTCDRTRWTTPVARYRCFAQLVAQETVWRHIKAMQRLVLRYGYPYSYDIDRHAIFRFLRDPQWKQVLRACGICPIYALSPKAKGKIERPHRWLQDHLIRTRPRDDITSLRDANHILAKEAPDYHYQRVPSTTGGDSGSAL